VLLLRLLLLPPCVVCGMQMLRLPVLQGRAVAYSTSTLCLKQRNSPCASGTIMQGGKIQ